MNAQRKINTKKIAQGVVSVIILVFIIIFVSSEIFSDGRIRKDENTNTPFQSNGIYIQIIPKNVSDNVYEFSINKEYKDQKEIQPMKYIYKGYTKNKKEVKLNPKLVSEKIMEPKRSDSENTSYVHSCTFQFKITNLYYIEIQEPYTVQIKNDNTATSLDNNQVSTTVKKKTKILSKIDYRSFKKGNVASKKELKSKSQSLMKSISKETSTHMSYETPVHEGFSKKSFDTVADKTLATQINSLQYKTYHIYDDNTSSCIVVITNTYDTESIYQFEYTNDKITNFEMYTGTGFQTP